MERLFPACIEKGVKVITNAGGVNGAACVDALVEAGRRAGVGGRARIARVTGDDLLDRLDALISAGHALRNMETGEPLETIRDRVASANFYLGARPIVAALQQGANVVVTGRSTDTALTYAPMIHEFGWDWDDHDRLAAGVIAGHINECGAQCTGGNCMIDWWTVPNLAEVGFPIIEASEDGTFVVTKHKGTGGRVNRATVTEQIVYEMGDPREYITPDVVADFTSFRMTDQGGDRVHIEGVRGEPATDTYKVSISYHDGWKSTGQLTVSGPDAVAKAELCAAIVWKRLAYDGFEYGADERLVEILGANVCHAGIAGATSGEPGEVVLRMGVKGPDRAKVDRFGSELVPLVTSGPPGVTGFAGGRPKATEIIGYWPALISKERVSTRVTVFEG
jgi:hypothetical protein